MPIHEHQSLRQDLVVCWVASLGASGLTLIDRSGRNNHGTLTNLAGTAPWSTAGGGGLSLAFPGASSPSLSRYVSARVNENGYQSGSFSASVWARYSGEVTANYPSLLCHSGANDNGTGYTFSVSPQSAALHKNCAYINLSDGTNSVFVVEPTAGNDGRWNNYALVRDLEMSLLSMFKNGAFVGSVSTSSVTGSLASDLPVAIGFRTDGSSFGLASNTFAGNIDDARIYKRALTLAEIRLLASRRGIGLTPLPDRAAGVPQKFRVKVGGVHEQADAYVRVAGVWRLAEARANDAGVWK